MHGCRFLEAWWNVTWLYLGFISVAAAFLADTVRGEPTVIVLCVAMLLLARDLRRERGITILIGILGLLGVALTFPAKYEVGALTLGLWVVIGVLVLASAFTTLILMLAWFAYCEPWRQRNRKQRRRRRRQLRG